MSETDRVQRWREAKRQKGLKPCTVWLTVEEELRLKDSAVQERCSASALVQRALAQYQPTKHSRISNDSDTEQLRSLIQEELAASSVVTATITDTLPAMVRAVVEELAREAMGMPHAATSTSSVTDTEEYEQTTEAPHTPVADTNSNVTEIEQPAAAPRKGGRQGTLRKRILELLQAHSAGFTATEIQTHLSVDRNLRDLLQRLVRDHLLEGKGSGAQVRYRIAGAQPTPRGKGAAKRTTARTRAKTASALG